LQLRTFLSKLNQHQEHRSRRSALFRLAIISSFGSKLCALALQTIAIPLVYRSLGEHRYEFYVLLTGALASIAVTQMGAGPGLTQGIAKANAAGRRDRETSLLHAAFRMTALAALIGGGIVLFAIHNIPPEKIFGPAFAQERATILSAANVCVFIVIAQLIAGVVDSALSGYQEQVFTSLGSTVANILSIGLLFYVCLHAPSVVGVMLVLYGAPTLSRVANIVGLFLRRPYLLHGVFRPCRGSYAALLNVGLAFWAVQIGSLIEQNGGVYVLAHLGSTRATDLFAVVYKALSLAGSVVIIITQPFWPAFVDAIAHRDFAWIRQSYARVRRGITIYSALVCLLMVTCGPWIFQHFVHIETAGNYWVFFILGLFFASNVWTHLYYVTLMGMPGLWKVAMVSLAENLLVLLAGLFFARVFGAAGMALAYLTASLALPAWLLPLLMKRSLQRIIDPASAPEEIAR